MYLTLTKKQHLLILAIGFTIVIGALSIPFYYTIIAKDGAGFELLGLQAGDTIEEWIIFFLAAVGPFLLPYVWRPYYKHIKKTSIANIQKEHKDFMKKKKEKLIHKYGKTDGMRVFSNHITETKLKKEIKDKERKKELIGKYGKTDGLRIFKGDFSEKDFVSITKLNKKYGNEIADKIFKKELFIDMTKEMLIDAHGNPGDIKEIVTKQKITHKYYYLPRTTQQYTTVYQLEVTLENDIVVGWKDLP